MSLAKGGKLNGKKIDFGHAKKLQDSIFENNGLGIGTSQNEVLIKAKDGGGGCCCCCCCCCSGTGAAELETE